MSERQQEEWEIRDSVVRVTITKGAASLGLRVGEDLFISLREGMSPEEEVRVLSLLRRQMEEGLL